MNSEQLKKLHMWPPISPSYSTWAKATSNRLGGLYYADEEDPFFSYMTWAARSIGDIFGSGLKDSLPRVEVHILDPRALNAVVAKHGDGYNIGIFQGLVINAVTAAMKLNSDLPKPVEDLDLLKYAGLILHFVCFHEVTHVLNGHVDFKRERMLGELMAEAIEPVDPEWSLISQTLEFDADAGGFQAATTSLLGLRQRRTPSGLRFDRNLPVDEMVGLSQILGRAIASYFFMTEGQKAIAADAWMRSHPPAVVRFKSVSALFARLLSMTESLTEHEADKCIDAFIIGATEAEIVMGEGLNRTREPTSYREFSGLEQVLRSMNRL
ncbi:hypothetical protein [Rhizobium viscosum]|uniref:Uncharacterized protein n=1 Tax=Rhizobium viscosum TaxID=1673 RepID=A0ABR9IUN3_RHIVS|nr:hypothetical protein [Rhizobium viscosum]MBE1506919.1 hypothetical protein [Rhizobium viscosum]